MSDRDNIEDQTPDLGVYARKAEAGLASIDKVAIGLTAAWLTVCALLWLAGPDTGASGQFSTIIALAAVLSPVALIWVGLLSFKSARVMQEEAARLRASLETMRNMYQTQAQIAATAMGPNVERKLDALVRGQKQTESALASFSSRRPVSEPRPAPQPEPVAEATPQTTQELPEQPGLALEPDYDPNASPVTNADFIVALNFPETADDIAGFEALRRALVDPRAARLVQASQDVLTLLSQDGIYMDDMTPDRARPEIWRRFADGERGRTIAALGGIRDRASLALVAQRMRSDQVFRDTSHHFLRTFDKTFASFSEKASDSEIIKITNTRTARAFMLLGRVAGLFD